MVSTFHQASGLFVASLEPDQPGVLENAKGVSSLSQRLQKLARLPWGGIASKQHNPERAASVPVRFAVPLAGNGMRHA
jgi:hypothetical protein